MAPIIRLDATHVEKGERSDADAIDWQQRVREPRLFRLRAAAIPQRGEGDVAAFAALDRTGAVCSRALRQCYAALSTGKDIGRREMAARLGLQYDYIEAAWRQANGIRDSARANHERLALRAEALLAEAGKTAPSVCFGSGKLFDAQHHIGVNDFRSHNEWLEAGRDA